MKGPPCIECGRTADRVTGMDLYPHRPDLYALTFWQCLCGAYCGSHKQSGKPLGYPCLGATRQARQAAHRAFDPLWQSGRMRRGEAYAWLAEQMGMPLERCHIGMMTREQALRVEEICSRQDVPRPPSPLAETVGFTPRTSSWLGQQTAPEHPPWAS